MSDTPADSAPPLMCVRHAQIRATQTCSNCGAGLCDMCGFVRPGGARLCPACAARATDTLARPDAVPRPVVPMARPAAQVWTPPNQMAGIMCATHPNVSAATKCDRCGAGICNTCDFPVQGLRPPAHLCPRCAVNPSGALSKPRKQLVIWGFVLAVWATIGLVVLLSGALARFLKDPSDRVILGWAITILIFFPALLGFGVSFSAQEKHLPNPPVIWAAITWNSMIVAGNVFLTVLGLMKQMH
jgi:hypothetical protein